MERTPIPIKDLSLDVFNPASGHEQLRDFTVTNGLIPVDDSHISVKALIKASRTKSPEYFISKTGRELEARANKAVYGAIEEKYSLMEGAGKGFWKRQWHTARSQVQSLVNKFTPDDTSIYGFLNEIDIQPTPADVIRYLASDDTDPRLKFETTRQGALALIAAELEVKTRGAEERLREVTELLDFHLFKKQAQKIQEVWALHDNATNAPILIDRDGLAHTPQEGAHWKLHKETMRDAGDGIGWVMTSGRIKEGGVNKTVKKAKLRDEKGEGNHFDPMNDVPDMIGKQLVAKDEDYSDGERVTTLLNKVKDILTQAFPGITFREKDGSTGNRTQSGKFQAYRLMADFAPEDGIGVPLELMFHGQMDQLKNDFEIGEHDEGKGKPNGAAHRITDADRSILVMEGAYFPNYPPEAPEDDKFYGKPKWGKVRRRVFNDITQRLQNAKLPDDDEIL